MNHIAQLASRIAQLPGVVASGRQSEELGKLRGELDELRGLPEDRREVMQCRIASISEEISEREANADTDTPDGDAADDTGLALSPEHIGAELTAAVNAALAKYGLKVISSLTDRDELVSSDIQFRCDIGACGTPRTLEREDLG